MSKTKYNHYVIMVQKMGGINHLNLIYRQRNELSKYFIFYILCYSFINNCRQAFKFCILLQVISFK